MKKGFFKLMTAAFAMVALASCSDDLGLSNDAPNLGKADLTATIMDLDNSKFTRLGMMETVDGMNPWKDGNAAGWGWAFTEGDQIRVFSMEAMTYEVYNLVEGANAATATFAKEKSVQTLPDGQKWAITDAQFVYSLSPTDEGKPRLTYTIPYVYKAQIQEGEKITKEVDGEETEVDANILKFAAPFWAKASEGEENAEGNVTLDASLAPMTAFLRVDMAQLPNDAKYIVLTTHGSVTKDEDNTLMYDGFQIVEPDPNQSYDLNGTTKVTQVKNNVGELVNYGGRTSYSWWEGDNVPAAITDGNSEQLSGTFNAILEVTGEGKDAVYPALGVDKGLEDGDDFYSQYGISRLVTRDEIRIDVRNLQARENGVFWIPIIAQHYNHLYVLAVTELSNYAYKYVGTQLADFTDYTFQVGEKKLLSMNMDNIGEVCPWHLNEAIDNINKANKQGIACDNILNVDKLTTCTDENHYFGQYTSGVYWHADGIKAGYTLAQAQADHSLFINYSEKYPHDKIWVQGEGNLVLNIAEISTETPAGKAGGSAYRTTATSIDRASGLLVSDVYNGELNQNYSAVAMQQIENNVTLNVPSTLDFMMCDLPKYNVTIAGNTNYTPAAAKDLVVDVHGAPTNFVTGRNVQEVSVDESGKASYGLKDFKSAAIKVVNGIKTLNVLQYTKGDVYVYPGMKENVEINTALNVYTQQGIDVRIDDALVYDLNYQFTSNQNPNYVYTTGSAAMHHVGVVNDPDYALVPNDVTLTSYWTGAALNYGQLYNDVEDGFTKYDNGTIYTVAQLASMGENEQAKYIIDDLVLDMWLGGSKYGWVGPNVWVDAFEFDGNGKALKNMAMPGPKSETTATYNTRKIYVYDPHFCCTTCGWERQTAGTESEGANGSRTQYLESWGLIRTIGFKDGDWDTEGAEGPVVISNVYLNDVYADDKDGAKDGSGVDNIGSILGRGAVEGDITFTNNIVGQVEIDVTGDNVGGMIGDMTADKLTVEDSKVGSRSKKVAGDDNVGGIVGAAEVDAIVMNNNSVTLTDGVYGNAFVGGLAGNVMAGDGLTLTPTQTTEEVATFVKQSVKAAKIQAYAKDLDSGEEDENPFFDRNDQFMPEGSIAGGFVGLLSAPAARIDTASVDVTDIIADSQFAGGLVAVSGCYTLNLYTANVKAGTVKAVEGYVGGELAYAPAGTVNVGYVPTKNINPETNIEIGKLAGPWAVGGVVGNNNNNAKIYVLASPKNGGAKGTTKYGYSINVNIGGYETTVDDVKAYFDANAADSKANYAGTFSNILGKLDGKLYINEALLTVTDNLDSATKKAVGYQERPDQFPTPGAEVELFWGDYNGYVGAGVSGNYFLTKLQADLEKSGSKVVGDQPNDETGFNLYKSEADYSATSKLVTE